MRYRARSGTEIEGLRPRTFNDDAEMDVDGLHRRWEDAGLLQIRGGVLSQDLEHVAAVVNEQLLSGPN